MDIRHLRNMLAVMDEGSIGKAAQRRNISQPALTKSIQRLEEHLGVRLFDREARGMKPTFYADSLRGYAKAACVGMAEAESQIASLRNGTEGIITVAGPPLIVTELLPGVLVRLSQERPKLQVRVVARNRELFADLLEGKFNLVVAMLYDDIPKQGLSKQWQFDDRLVLVMRPDHPLAKRRKVKPADLLDQKWVFADSDTWSHRRLRLYFEQAGLTMPRHAPASQAAIRRIGPAAHGYGTQICASAIAGLCDEGGPTHSISLSTRSATRAATARMMNFGSSVT